MDAYNNNDFTHLLFFFNVTPTTEIYTLSLHDALPILLEGVPGIAKTLTAKLVARSLSVTFSRIQFTPDLMPTDVTGTSVFNVKTSEFNFMRGPVRSEEHTSEFQSLAYLVCRLLLEKKKSVFQFMTFALCAMAQTTSTNPPYTTSTPRSYNHRVKRLAADGYVIVCASLRTTISDLAG